MNDNQEKDNNEENKNNDNAQENQENEGNNNSQNEDNDNEMKLYNNWKKHLDELKNKTKMKRLSPEEEKMLVLCIRFSYLSHSDLINLTNEPIMENYKDLILQGLSARLDTYENTNEKNIIINLTPRHYLREYIKKNKSKKNNDNKINEEDISINNFNKQSELNLKKRIN